MIPKFNCSACGKCCSKIGGFISSAEKEFIMEYGYGKMPLIQVIPVSEMTFPLWDFEAKRFFEYEKKVKIDAKIRPSRGIFDLNSGKFIVVTYHMNSISCPFILDSGKCSIYNTKRAFICHLFPFNKSPFLDMSGEDSWRMFGSCPNILDIIDKLDYPNKKELVKQLHDSFGETFLAAVQHDYVIEWSNRTILELVKNEKIRPAMNYPYDKLVKRISNSEKVDFMDFLVEINYMNKEEVSRMVKRFENFEDAKERLKEYIDVSRTIGQ